MPYLRLVKYTGIAGMFSGVTLIAVANILGDVKSAVGYTGLAIALPSVLIAGIALMLDAGRSYTTEPEEK